MLRKSPFILTLLLGLVMLPAYGYTGNTIRTMVPFSFVVQGKTLPAGDYEFIQTNARQDNEWLIRNVKNDSQEVLLTAEQEEVAQPKLETYVAFEEIHNTHYLSDIWTAGTVDGWHVPVEAEKGLASGKQPKMRKVQGSLHKSQASR